MPRHWSYTDSVADDLRQGDILIPNEELKTIIRDIHPHFSNHQKYLAFIVITQSCDLVRRKAGSCKSAYIEIAVVRSMRHVLLQVLKDECQCIGEDFFKATERTRAEAIIDKILNQNEWGQGLFYLHPDSDIGFSESAVAVLRVSVAMKSVHYSTLLASRKGSLTPEFANKLGWTVGNLYSRVGVRDWNEDPQDKAVATEIKKGLLNASADSGPKFIECPKDFLKALDEGKIDLSGKSTDEVKRIAITYQRTPHLDQAMGAVREVLMEMLKVDDLVRRRLNPSGPPETIRPELTPTANPVAPTEVPAAPSPVPVQTSQPVIPSDADQKEYEARIDKICRRIKQNPVFANAVRPGSP